MAQLTARRGDDKAYLATFEAIGGGVQDLTGCTVFFTVKASTPVEPNADLDDASARLRYYWKHDGENVVASNGMSIPTGKTPGDGQLEVRFPRSLTTTWPKFSELYEVQVTLPDAEWEDGEFDDTWDSGTLTVALDLNRRRTP